MRIALVHSFYSSSQPSGENSVVVDQARVLLEAGHDVAVVARRTDDEQKLRAHGLKAAVRVATGFGGDPTDELRAIEPDVVHLHNLFPNFGTAWVPRWPGPLVVSIHNYRFACANGLLFRDGHACLECPQQGMARSVVHRCYRDSVAATLPLAVSRRRDQRRVLSRADAVITTSRASDELLRSVIPVPMSTVVIPNFGLDDGNPPLPATERDGWVALGRLTPEKGLRDLVQQWPDGHHLTLIGSGPQEEEIRAIAERRGIDFLPSMSRDDLRARLARFTGLVFPSRWAEVAPQVVVEAMRVGLPVVALDQNGVADEVRESGAGSVYSDTASLVTALLKVEAECDALSRAASEHYGKTWRPDIWLAAVEAVYTRLVARSGR